MADTEYYDILGAQKDEDIADIKRKYRKLAMKYHPDQQHDKSDAEKADAASKMSQINQAWEILNNAEKRAIYDAHGKAGLEKAASGQSGGGGAAQFREEKSFSSMFEETLGKAGQNPNAKVAPGFGGFKKKDPFAAFKR